MSLVQMHPFNFTSPVYFGVPNISPIPFSNIRERSSMPEILKQSKKFAPLKTIVERVASGYEKEIKEALVKKEWYFSRLFSTETRDQWCDHRTPLGQAIALIMEYWENPSHGILRRLKPLLMKANEEAKELSCSLNLSAGAMGSALTQSPLPMIWGVSECWMKVHGEPEVINTIPDYQTSWNKVDYQVPDDVFRDTNGQPLNYSAALTNGESLPSTIKFTPSTRHFSGRLGDFNSVHVRVFAKDPQNVEAYNDFTLVLDARLPLVVFLPTFGAIFGLAFCCYWRYDINPRSSKQAYDELS